MEERRKLMQLLYYLILSRAPDEPEEARVMAEVLCAAVIRAGDVHSASSASLRSWELGGAGVSCRLGLRMRGQADPSVFLIQEDQLVMITVWVECQLLKE